MKGFINLTHTNNGKISKTRTELLAELNKQIDNIKNTFYDKNEIQQLIANLSGIQFQVVDKLPIENILTNVIYLVKITDTEEQNIYDEYMYINGSWEKIGSTGIKLDNIYTKEQTDDLLLDTHKQILLGADGIVEEKVYNFTVESANSYLPYKTNGTKFLVDLHLPIVGDLDLTKKVAITFGDTVYYVYNILKGHEPATIGDLSQVDKYNNAIGYRFIVEMTFFENSDIVGFAIIPTISMSDVLSLDSDEMDNYVTDGGLSQGQLAICNKVNINGYIQGALYKFNIMYPDTYSWIELGGGIKLSDLPTIEEIPDDEEE